MHEDIWILVSWIESRSGQTSERCRFHRFPSSSFGKPRHFATARQSISAVGFNYVPRQRNEQAPLLRAISEIGRNGQQRIQRDDHAEQEYPRRSHQAHDRRIADEIYSVSPLRFPHYSSFLLPASAARPPSTREFVRIALHEGPLCLAHQQLLRFRFARQLFLNSTTHSDFFLTFPESPLTQSISRHAHSRSTDFRTERE